MINKSKDYCDKAEKDIEGKRASRLNAQDPGQVQISISINDTTTDFEYKKLYD